MEQILEHIADEQEIKIFHQWISDLCNPDSKIVQDSGDLFKTIFDEYFGRENSKFPESISPEQNGQVFLYWHMNEIGRPAIM